jgi:hypothetical protein
MLTIDEKQQHILQTLQERFLVQGQVIREDTKYYYTADGSKFNKRWYRLGGDQLVSYDQNRSQ